MLTYLRDNFEEVWGVDPSTQGGFDQKLLALKVLLESQSNNSAIGIDIAILRKEVTKLSNAKKQKVQEPHKDLNKKEGGEPDFDPTALVMQGPKKKGKGKKKGSTNDSVGKGGGKIVKAMSKQLSATVENRLTPNFNV